MSSEKTPTNSPEASPATRTLADRFEQADREAHPEKVFITEDNVRGAMSLNDLVKNIYGTEGLYGKRSVKANVMDKVKGTEAAGGTKVTKTELFKANELKKTLESLGDLLEGWSITDPEKLKISSSEDGSHAGLLSNLPQERGFRAQAAFLYDKRRQELLGITPEKQPEQPPKKAPETKPEPKVKVTPPEQAPAPKTPEKAPEPEIIFVPVKVKQAAAPKETDPVADVLRKQEVEKLEIRYLKSVSEYHGALKKALARFEEESNKGGFNSVKKLFGWKPKPSESDVEELRDLRYKTTSVWNETKEEVETYAANNFQNEAQRGKFVAEVGKRIEQDIKDLATTQRADILAVEVAAEYEEVLFGDTLENSPDYNAAIEIEEGRRAKEKREAEQRAEEARILAEVGKFVPAGEKPVVIPTGWPKNFKGLKVKNGEEKTADPEATIKALEQAERMKQENQGLDEKAKELSIGAVKSGYNAFKLVGQGWNKLSKRQKLVTGLGFASVGLLITATAGAGGALFATLALSTVRRGIVAAGVTAGVEAALITRAGLREKAGKEEDRLTRNKEWAALSAGALAFFLPKLVSGEVHQIISNTHVGEHIKDWFVSLKTSIVGESAATLPSAELPPADATVEAHPHINLPAETPAPMPDPLPSEHVLAPAPTDLPTVPPAEIPEPTNTAAVEQIAAAKTSSAKEVFINDKLGRKGDSIWGSLKHNGVSERAIANYERHHHHAINRMARNGDKVSFVYDEQADKLHEVKIEHVAKRIGKRAAKVISTTGKGDLDHTDTPTGHEAVNGAGHEHNALPKKQLAPNTTTATEQQPTPDKTGKLKFSAKAGRTPVIPTKLVPDLPAVEDKDFLDTAAGDKTLYGENIPARNSLNSPVGIGNIEITNPQVIAEVKQFFGDVKDKAWQKLAGIDATKAIKTGNADDMLKLLGKKNFSVDDAQSGRAFLATVSNESGLKPKRGEKVLAYITRAMEKVSNSSQK